MRSVHASNLIFRVGKSLEIIPLGTTQLKMGDDQYEW